MRGDVVDVDGWHGLTEAVPLVVLLDVAAVAGTRVAADRLAAALAERSHPP